MRLIQYFIAASLVAGMVLACGCTSTAPPSSAGTNRLAATPTTTASATNETEYIASLFMPLMLTQADLPIGPRIYWQGGLTIPSDDENPLGLRGGYHLSANRPAGYVAEEEISHTVAYYDKTDTPLDLDKVLPVLYPALINNSSLSSFPASLFGDDSRGYVWEMPKGSLTESPNTSVSGALVLFRYDGIIETVHVIGVNMTANRSLALDLTGKAAAKLV